MTDPTDETLRALYAARAANDPDTAHPDPEQLADAALRRGPEAPRLATLDHVLSCTRCRKELELLQVADLAGQRLVHRHRGTRFVLAIAAALVVAIALKTLLPRSIRERLGPRTGDAERGAPVALGAELDVIGPQDTIAPGATPSFIWHRASGATEYLVEIVDDSGLVVTRSRTTDTTLPWPGLHRGVRYHWRVSATTPGGGVQSPFIDFLVPDR